MLSEVEAPSVQASYRHVVFADAAFRDRRPLNFSGNAPIDCHAQRQCSHSLTPDERLFVNWLFDLAGIAVQSYRMETLARRLPACLRMIRATTIQEARAAIEANPALVQNGIRALVIGVSGFFRDPALFAALRGLMLAELTGDAGPLRIWSVGCSDGRELYSVMMMMAELGWFGRCEFLGTDCRLEAIRCASEGVYIDDEVHGLPGDMLDRGYLVKCGSRCWQMSPWLRNAARWRTGDVLQTVEPGSWDMILCRNMAIYLEPGSASMLWDRLRTALRPGRLLVVGKAERPIVAGLSPVAPCLFRRAGGNCS
jgi:chemotaxis protein methyltransferase CheR